MQKKTKTIIMIGILLLILISISILVLNKTKFIQKQINQLAQAQYTTTIGSQTYDITNAVLEANEIIPTISAGMIPVKWDGANWVITTKEDEEWYNYANGNPAYIMLNDGVYQSELLQDMTGKKLAKENIGIQIQETEVGTIYMWIPRYAYNEAGEIIYIKQGHSVAGTWTIPETFIHKTDKIDFSLSGIWVEYKPLTSKSAVTTKVKGMTGEENKYGFIANTIGVSATDDPLTQTTIERYINIIGNDAIIVPPIVDIENIYRTILNVVDTNKLEPIKGIAVFNKDEMKIEINVTYRSNEISKILDKYGDILKENSEKAIDTNILGNGTYRYTVIDNVGNLKEIVLKVEGLKEYYIPNLKRLKEFRDEVNAGNDFSGITVIQTADIQMNEGKYTINEETGEITFEEDAEQWEPIGTSSKYFNGTYDGRGHTISGIYIDNDLYYQGLFGYVSSGTIKNLNIKKSKIIGGQYVGGIVGYLYNSSSSITNAIENCSNGGVIIVKSDYVGGIAGYSTNVSITNCYNIGNVISKSNKAGGICGYSNSNITNCYNKANIIGNYDVGGIIGSSAKNVENCYNIGEIMGNNNVGGIIGNGNSKGNLRNCYNVGTIKNQTTVKYVGGIAGNCYLIVERCFNMGNIELNEGKYIGGIVGEIRNDIKNCYNLADIMAISGECIGGISGLVMGNTTDLYNIGKIYANQCNNVGGIIGNYSFTNPEKCYNAGEVNGYKNVAGIAGYSGNGGKIVKNAYNLANVEGHSNVGKICAYCYGGTRFENCYSVEDLENKPSATTVISVINGNGAFIIDKYNINQGLPILSWQTDNDKLDLINGDGAFVEDTEGINNGYPLLAWQVGE